MSGPAVLIVLLVLLAFLLRIDFIFYIVYVVGGIYVWSRWAMPYAFRHIRVEREFTDHVFLGERVAVKLRIENEGRIPIPSLQVIESVPPQLATSDDATVGKLPAHAFSLPGRRERTFLYEIQATRRGYYRLGPLTVRGSDFFGWNERALRSRYSYLTVYPRIIPIAELGLPSRLPFGTLPSKQRLFADPARPAGVRDYRSGDSLRQINWKVSAHGRNLVVKTLQPAISLETAILLNLHRDDFDRRNRYSGPEWAIEVAASLAAHLTQKQQAVGLVTNGNDPLHRAAGANDADSFDELSGRLLQGDGDARAPSPIAPRTGRAHLMKLLEVLARIDTGSGNPLLTWLPRACLNLGWGVTLLIITPVADEATCRSLHQLARQGFNPILLVTAPTLAFGKLKSRARHYGFAAYNVTGEHDLAQWQARRLPHAN